LASAWRCHKIIRTLEDIGDSEEKVDALVSDLGGVLIGVKTADCVPVLIGDPKTTGVLPRFTPAGGVPVFSRLWIKQSKNWYKFTAPIRMI